MIDSQLVEIGLAADFLESGGEPATLSVPVHERVKSVLDGRGLRPGCPHLSDKYVRVPVTWRLGEDMIRCWKCSGVLPVQPTCSLCGSAGVASYAALCGLICLYYTVCAVHDEPHWWESRA